MQLELVSSSTPTLDSWLVGYLSAQIDTAHETVTRMVTARPGSFIQFILEGEHALRDASTGQIAPAPQVALFGPTTGHHYDMVITGRLRTFCVLLQPTAASKLFAIKAAPLVNGHVALDVPPELLTQLAVCADEAEIASRLDRWITALTPSVPPIDRVAIAANTLRRSDGAMSVTELATMAGLSMRHFQRTFKERVGINPKHYAAICRLAKAVELRDNTPDLPWASIATDCGYTDQAHLIRDFKLMVDRVPTRYKRYDTLANHDASEPA